MIISVDIDSELTHTCTDVLFPFTYFVLFLHVVIQPYENDVVFKTYMKGWGEGARLPSGRVRILPDTVVCG